MKNYLSFGGGVNSVALHLLMLEKGIEFESVFVNHGCDWPHTYQYVAGFQWWLKANGHRPITVLKPHYQGFDDLFEFCWHYRMVPFTMARWCTANFKVSTLLGYYSKPAWEFIGIDAGESHRAKIQTRNGVESRYPLIEDEIDRAGCENIIRRFGLPVPKKSGCYICPFQKKSQWRELRRDYPCLFKKVVDLEQRNIDYRIERGKKPLYLCQSPRASLSSIVDDSQIQVFEGDEYPPCMCGL